MRHFSKICYSFHARHGLYSVRCNQVDAWRATGTGFLEWVEQVACSRADKVVAYAPQGSAGDQFALSVRATEEVFDPEMQEYFASHASL